MEAVVGEVERGEVGEVEDGVAEACEGVVFEVENFEFFVEFVVA